MPDANRVIVVGAGISGLTCAYKLMRVGLNVTLLESSERPGGLIWSIEQDGFLFERGPQSFQGTAALLDLIRELGISDELLEADFAAPRYVLRAGRLQKIPISPQAMIGSSLLGPGSRWKIVSEPFRRTRPPGHEESVAEFVRRKFGHEILEYLVSPFVSGVYAGDPERLSLRAAFPTLEEWERQFGSVLRGAMKSRPANAGKKKSPPLCSFRRGLSTLTDALARSLGPSIRTGACVAKLSRGNTNGASFDASIIEDGKSETISAAALVLATPAYASGQLVQAFAPQLAPLLSGIPYAPVAVTAAGYYEKQFARLPEGFGFLVPRKEKMRTLGTVWNSSLFPGRAPEGRALMTSFLGGATDPELVQQPEDEIAMIAGAENRRILQISGPPIVSVTWKHAKALPQYNLGHGHIVEGIREAQGATPGAFFAGNYLEGPAIGKCVEQASRTAEAVRDFIREND